MPNVRFIPRDDNGKLEWIKRFAKGARAFMQKIGLESADEYADQIEIDARVFEHIVTTRQVMEAYVRGLTAWQDDARGGTKLSAFPQPPQIEPAPEGAKPGIFPRNARLAAYLKKHPGYTDAEGELLGLVAPQKAPMVSAGLQPVLKVVARVGCQPMIKWKKGRTSGIEIHVKRGDGPFELMTYDMNPDALDTAPLPPPGKAEVWTYKAIYLGRDQVRIGQWSGEVSVAVSR